MNELYWITRLDALNMLLTTIIIVAIIATIIGIVTITNCDSESDDEMEIKRHRLAKKLLKIASTILLLSSVVSVLTPTTKEALVIWGVGGTIDWVKSNDTAKQLPDKCVKALDRWVDNIENDSIK